jgi:hypoxanthine phosphoribosyltransferase
LKGEENTKTIQRTKKTQKTRRTQEKIDDYIENQIKFKTIINQKNSVVDMENQYTKLPNWKQFSIQWILVETHQKVGIPLKKHLFNKTIGNFGSTINSKLE